MNLLPALENGLFALGQVLRFPIFVLLWVCVPIYVARSYVTILLGNLSSDPSKMGLVVLIIFDVLKVGICALVIWRLRVHHRKYHGHHDDVLVSIQPPRDAMGPVESPNTVPASAGIPRSRVAETVIAPYNEPEMLEGILRAHAGEIAAILVEPVQFNIGVVPPKDG